MTIGLMAAGLAILAAQVSPLEPLAKLAGVWTGVCSGRPGTGTVTKTFKSLYDGAFVQCETVLNIPAKDSKPANQHRELSIFSFDAPNQRIRMRQFHNEGFVHTYEMKSSSPGHWISEGGDVENLPKGFRPRLAIDIGPDGALTEVFSLAEPGKDFTDYVKIVLRRRS